MKAVLPLLSVLLAVGVVGYVGACLYLYFMQRSIMYFPTPPPGPVRDAEALSVESGDATIRVWRLNGQQPNAILYFGGNAEDVAGNVPDFSEWFSSFAVYLVHYRGYGESTGMPTEEALYRDAEAIFDMARKRHDRVAVLGRSLGSGVATHLATVREVNRLALVSPATSFADLAHELYPMFPTGLLLKDRYDSLGRAQRISAPVLILVAEHDQTIPPEHSAKLAQAIGSPQATLRVIPNTDHNSIGATREYGPALRSFFQGMR